MPSPLHSICFQIHGYRSGHQLLSSNVKLHRSDQDTIDRLSDMAGQLRPGETFSPYLTGYPLPSGLYYVLAKTWQDSLASRSGCVWTQSLVITISHWSELKDIKELVSLFTTPDVGESKREYQGLQAVDHVSDPRRYELVEALFLEERRPIVMFDCDEAEAISLRVLNSLLSGLRAQFAFGTYALAPRSLGGTYFDLLFAPASARARFSPWTGRRIDKAKTDGGRARHRWTADLVQLVFDNSGRRLEVDEALGFSDTGDVADESALRLSLRWKELVGSAANSPTAVLGLLDILNARRRLPLEDGARLFPVIENSVAQVVTRFSTSDAWSYLSALANKFPRGRLPSKLRKSLHWAVTSLSERSPTTAIQYLNEIEITDRKFSALFETWVGDGIAQSSDLAPLLSSDQTIISRLVCQSRKLSRTLVKKASLADGMTYQMNLEGIAGLLDTAGRARLLRSTARYLTSAKFAPYLSLLLEGASIREIIRAVGEVGLSTSFSVPEFDEHFISAASENVSVIRDEILRFEPNENVDRFLLSTLSLRPDDLDWIANELGVSEHRKAKLLRQVIENSDERQVLQMAKHQRWLPFALTILLRELKENSDVMSRLILAKPMSSKFEFDIAFQVLDKVKKPLKPLLARSMLDWCIAADSNHEAPLDEVMLRFIQAGNSPSDLAKLAISPLLSERSLRRNAAEMLGEKAVRDLIADEIELVSNLLMKQRHVLTETIYKDWASLISAHVAKRSFRFAPWIHQVLTHSLRLTSTKASSLIVATFPMVYRFYKSPDNRPGWFGADKAKWLARDLSQEFVRSVWPVEDLIKCALGSGEPKEIFKKVAETWRGEGYLTMVESVAKTLPANIEKQVLKSLPFKKAKNR